jgi:ribosome biogenesis GTPase
VTLADLGWDSAYETEFEPYGTEGLDPARIATRHRTAYEVLTEHGGLGAQTSGRLHDSGRMPAVGDWVAVAPLPGEGRVVIHAVLPRRSSFSRKEAWVRTEEQVVAANVDTVFIVSALRGDFNVRRLERYLAAGWDSGAQPVVVVNKTDICAPEDVAAAVRDVEAVAFGVPVHAVSAVTAGGLEELRAYLATGRTVALLGSSGVGKSTLANRLLGRDLLATGNLREDGRGRHTTTRRELVPVPGGGLLLDTPGMRELQLWDDAGGLQAAFGEIAELAAACHFADCSHESEPGCAVRAALADGRLDRERLASYRKLERELHALAVRQDKRLASEVRKRRRRDARGRRKAQW